MQKANSASASVRLSQVRQSDLPVNAGEIRVEGVGSPMARIRWLVSSTHTGRVRKPPIKKRPRPPSADCLEREAVAINTPSIGWKISGNRRCLGKWLRRGTLGKLRCLGGVVQPKNAAQHASQGRCRSDHAALLTQAAPAKELEIFRRSCAARFGGLHEVEVEPIATAALGAPPPRPTPNEHSHLFRDEVRFRDDRRTRIAGPNSIVILFVLFRHHLKR